MSGLVLVRALQGLLQLFFCNCFAFKNLQGLLLSHIKILYVTWRSIVGLAAVMIKSIQLLQNTEILTSCGEHLDTIVLLSSSEM